MQKNFDFSLNSDPFLLGAVYDLSNIQVDSYVVQGVAIPFGAPVILGDDPVRQVKLATTATSVTGFIGIAIRQNFAPSGGVLATTATADEVVTISTGINAYPAGSSIAIAKSGRVIVKVDVVTTAIVGTSRLVYTLSNGTVTSQTTAATAGTSIDLGFILTVPTAGQLCAIQINKLLQ